MASYSGVRLVSSDEVSRITHPANRPNVRYRYEGWNIKFDWLLLNQPTKIQVNVSPTTAITVPRATRSGRLLLTVAFGWFVRLAGAFRSVVGGWSIRNKGLNLV